MQQQSRTRAVGVVAWVALAILLALIVSRQLAEIIPEGIASHVGRNSEGYLATLVLVPWILFVRARAGRSVRTVAAALSLGFLVLGLVLITSDFTSTVKTLNEPAFAIAVLVAYVALPRPLPAWGWGLPVLAVLVAIVTSPTDLGTDLAEAYLFLVVVPITLDWAARPALEPDQPLRLGRLVAWTGVLVALPTLFAIVRPDQPYENLLEETLRYLSRPTEAFVCSVLLLAFLAWGPWLLGTRASDAHRVPSRTG